jgi:hypothetical protein
MPMQAHSEGGGASGGGRTEGGGGEGGALGAQASAFVYEVLESFPGVMRRALSHVAK